MKRLFLWFLHRLSWKGLSPETMALSIVLGVILGVFPMYGVPTVLCFIAAIIFRPHIPLLQAINAITGPLQIALLLPFHQVGQFLLQGAGPVKLAGKWYAVSVIFNFTSRTAAGWLVVCVPLGLAMYLLLVRVLRRHATLLPNAA